MKNLIHCKIFVIAFNVLSVYLYDMDYCFVCNAKFMLVSLQILVRKSGKCSTLLDLSLVSFPICLQHFS